MVFSHSVHSSNADIICYQQFTPEDLNTFSSWMPREKTLININFAVKLALSQGYEVRL